MICNAIYDSYDAIPEALRAEFEQVDGKWQIKADAIPGAGPLFNKALAANEQKAVGQVKTRNARITALETERDTAIEERDAAKDELTTYKQPGAKVLSKDDAENWDKYVKLGTPKDIEDKVTKAEALETEVTEMKTSQTVAEIAEKAKLKADVLTDWVKSGDAEGVDFFMKSIIVKDDKGKEETREVAHARFEVTEAGKKITRETPLIDFAKEKMPEWKFKALTENGGEPDKKKGVGVQMPNLGSAASAGAAPTDNKTRAVDRFNAERAARPSPFAPKTPAK